MGRSAAWAGRPERHVHARSASLVPHRGRCHERFSTNPIVATAWATSLAIEIVPIRFPIETGVPDRLRSIERP